MEYTESRELRLIDPSWSTPQLLEALLDALTGEGPALTTVEISQSSLDPKSALVLPTSGSTGSPKSVVLSAKALITNARSTHKYLEAKSGERWSLLLPTHHIAGINVLVRSIELGTIPVGVDSIADYTAIVPTQLYRALHGDQKLLTHLQQCQAVLVGGAPLDPDLRAEAQSSGIKIIATYGMTESCGGVVYDGVPLTGIELRIIEGRIAIRGPQIALGYLGEAFPLTDGFFLTQDLGEIENGILKVLGRSDDQIISGGEKISLSAIENFLQGEFAHSEIIAFSKSDDQWGEKLCLASTGSFTLEELTKKVKERFGNHAAPKELFQVEEIPYLSIGKPDRKKLARDHAS